VKPVLDAAEVQKLYQPFDWSQEGVPLKPGSPAATAADFLDSLREARWEDAALLVVPALRGTRDKLYLESGFGPVIKHLDRWLILKQIHCQEQRQVVCDR